ncbi:MAG: ROK family protein [Ilumatobacteraceae bacterium]
MTAVGVDVGGTKILAAAFGAGDQEARVESVTPIGRPGDLVAAITAAVGTIRNRLDEPITGVGIGIPGRVDTAGGTVRGAVNLGLGAQPLEIAALVGRQLSVVCHVDNDVNCAALGAFELLRRQLAGDELVYLSIGTGLAAGVILDGKVRRGQRGLAGEIGHLPMDGDRKCRCGLNGCLEVVASGETLARQWPTTDGLPAAQALVAAVAAGDRGATQVLAEFATHLADAVHVLAVTYDVEPIIVGGGVADAGEPLLDAVRSVLRERESASDFARALALSERLLLKPDGPVGAIGAAALVRQEGS